MTERQTEPAEVATGRIGRPSPGRLQAVTAGVIAGAVAVAGCVSVTAPEEPIVIELNVNIKQEVVYRLAADAGNTIKQNPEIF